jgi:hypothetical protein
VKTIFLFRPIEGYWHLFDWFEAVMITTNLRAADVMLSCARVRLADDLLTTCVLSWKEWALFNFSCDTLRQTYAEDLLQQRVENHLRSMGHEGARDNYTTSRKVNHGFLISVQYKFSHYTVNHFWVVILLALCELSIMAGMR